jgi:hypothetical protein
MCQFVLFWIIGLLAGMMVPWSATAQAVPELEASIVIHFQSGKSFLEVDDKAKLRKFFHQYKTGPKSRVFVVGYTDSVGDKRANYKLSRKRAQSVRRELISEFGLNGALITAVGKGEETPVGDNGKAAGRSSNRRAEIYLVHAEVRKPRRVYGPNDPYHSDIESLIKEARKFTKQRRIGEAVKVLNKARGLGGDYYSDWHAAYGIAGFYAHAPEVKINAHLTKALRLDPYNYMAREYLYRMRARQKVARGEVTPDMGLSATHAIGVNSVAQQHEYLRLFKVEPMAHRTLDWRPVDVWECVNASGAPVVYHFDNSGAYEWAFSLQSGAPKAGPEGSGPSKPFIEESVSSVTTIHQQPAAVPGNPKKIWESKIFN